MSDKQPIPRLLREGIQHMAHQGVIEITEIIVEEYAEKLKQDFKARMHERMQSHISISLEDALDGENLKVTVDVNLRVGD